MVIIDKVKEVLGLKKRQLPNKPSKIKVTTIKNEVVIVFDEPVISISFNKMQLLELIETLTSKLPTIKK